MKKILAGSLLALAMIITSAHVAQAASTHSFGDLRTRLTQAQDKAGDIWSRMNQAIDKADAHGIDTTNAEALHDEAQARYETLKGDLDTLVAMIDEGASVSDMRAELVTIKTDFTSWKSIMQDISGRLHTAYENHTATPTDA